jgi:hypoxanthine phosphoribosyltransferase
MPEMIHVTAQDMLVQSFRLGRKIYESGFRPKHAISIWRGGTPVGLGVDAFFRQRGHFINHTTIATESYAGIGVQEHVTVKGLEHVVRSACREDALLIIDDVYESGNTINAILDILRERTRANFPERILVGTLHRKPEKVRYSDVEVCSLCEMPADCWIDYPHELADLVTDDPDDPLIRQKDERVWQTIRQHRFEPVTEHVSGPYKYIQPDELLLDALRLGINVFADTEFQPDFIVALWPGGVSVGLPLHEAYKYKMLKTGQQRRRPDHISLTTAATHLSYRTTVLGLDYLAQRVNRDHNILLIDSTFKGGRLVNDIVIRLKEVLRRNLKEERVRVAAVYYNPDDQSTWTTKPVFLSPHYYVRKVDASVVYPHAVHRLRDPVNELATLNPDLHRVLFGA